MGIEGAIKDYNDAVAESERIVNRHMAAAMSEIKEKYGLAPVSVSLTIIEEKTMADRFATGVMAGSSVEFDR
jgi:hypothetical protein